MYKPSEIKWWKRTKEEDIQLTDTNRITTKRINAKQIQSTHVLHIHGTEDNGTYLCEIEDSVTSKNVSGTIDILVYTTPQVFIHKVIPINTTQLYINWTVNAFNLPIEDYTLMYLEANDTGYRLHTEPKLDPKNTSFVLGNLSANTTYRIKLEVKTAYGRSKPDSSPSVTTLAKEPIFVPNISINGFSATSVTIGWAPPPEDIAELIHFYLLEARKKDDDKDVPRSAFHQRDGRNLPYMFDHLEPHSTYVFKVRCIVSA